MPARQRRVSEAEQDLSVTRRKPGKCHVYFVHGDSQRRRYSNMCRVGSLALSRFSAAGRTTTDSPRKDDIHSRRRTHCSQIWCAPQQADTAPISAPLHRAWEMRRPWDTGTRPVSGASGRGLCGGLLQFTHRRCYSSPRARHLLGRCPRRAVLQRPGAAAHMRDLVPCPEADRQIGGGVRRGPGLGDREVEREFGCEVHRSAAVYSLP